MELHNLSPLICQPLTSLMPNGDLQSVVIVKVTLELVPGDPALHAQGLTHTLKLSQDQQPLRLEDTWHGDGLKTSVRWESELAPAKPKCDVIVLGDAFAPRGKPRRRFPVSVKIQAPDRERPAPPMPKPIGYGMAVSPDAMRAWEHQAAHARAHPIQGETLLEKRLQVTGERWLLRHTWLSRTFWWFLKLGTFGLIRRCPWSLTRPGAIPSLPMRYEYAFGGQVRVMASDAWSGRVAERWCLPGVDKPRLRQAWKQTREEALLAEAWWEENPVGRCFAPAWHLRAARTKRLPAPQIEDPDHPFTARAAWKAMLGKAQASHRRALKAQGLGLIARTWEPRLKEAGSFDAAWAASGAPYPPDYSLAFNNCAHQDLQCRHLAGDETVELINLCAESAPGACKDARGNQLLRFQLPGLHPFLLVGREEGTWEQIPAVLDTLILEPDEGRVTFLQRASFPATPEPAVLELRLAMPGEAREVVFLPAEEPAPEVREPEHVP